MSTRSTYTPSRLNGTSSPPHSTTGTSTTGPQLQRMNIVTRLAIEGKAKRDEPNVPIKMYLKLAIPTDNISPGTAIPLFKEENVKILEFEVHPLDTSSVPYNFSSATSPLLHNAARALNLPARSPNSYLTLFGQQAPASSSRSRGQDDIPRLEEKYTGHVLVSGYQVSFVLPKEFPPKSRLNGLLEDGDNYTRPPMNGSRHRRGSMGDKNVILFMAGISMMVPYLSKPPRAPWLLSIPTPRCLSNHLKLSIFPPHSPPSLSTSFQSLSSAEADSETSSWDMTADPHVTRAAGSRRASSYQLQHFADDESSDSASSPGFSDGVGIQGTFPSAERIRVRWAAPVRRVDDGAHDGRRRVGVTSARGEMVCTPLGRGRDRTGGKEGVVMHLEYNGVCKGVWFPGVATLLGMDVGLEAKSCEVSWAEGHEAKWQVVGGMGYTGHEVGGTPSRVVDRQTSFDMPQLTVSPDTPVAGPSNLPTPTRQTSSASLLRAPLPNQHVPEYSFEEGDGSAPSEGGMSSVLSTTDPESRGRSRASSLADPEPDVQRPSVPITLHLNINDLLPPNKNVFSFSISGVVLITPRTPPPAPDPADPAPTPPDSEDASKETVVSLPRFRVLAADAEKIDTTVRNGVEGRADVVELYASADPQARRAELARGGRAKVGADGGRIALRPATLSKLDVGGRSPSRPRTPTDAGSALRDALLASVRPRRDGPLMIPYIVATVTPLVSAATGLQDAYAVRAVLPAPADENAWLEFGVAKGAGGAPRVEVTSVSLEGVPVRFEASAGVKPEMEKLASVGGGMEWIMWVRVHVGTTGGGAVEIVYTVKEQPGDGGSKKGKGKQTSGISVILPTFSLPVGRLQVDIDCPSGFEIASLQSNLAHEQRSANGGRRLLHYALGEFFHTQIHLRTRPRAERQTRLTASVAHLFRALAYTAPIISAAIVFFLIVGLHSDILCMQHKLETSLASLGGGAPGWATSDLPIVTVTATVVAHDPDAGKWPPTESPHTSPLEATPSSAASRDPAHPTSITMIDVTSPTPTPRPEWRPKTEETPPPKGSTALGQLRQLWWPTIPWTKQQVADAVVGGLSTVWHVMRMVYHWPLDAP